MVKPWMVIVDLADGTKAIGLRDGSLATWQDPESYFESEDDAARVASSVKAVHPDAAVEVVRPRY